MTEQWLQDVLSSFDGKANGWQGRSGEPLRVNWRDHVYTAAELQRRTFPPISYCVPG